MKKTLSLLCCAVFTLAQAEEVEVIEITSEPPAVVANAVVENTTNAAPTRSVGGQASQTLPAVKPSGTLEQRLARLERQFANSAETDVPAQLNQLRQELQALRGEQEVQAHNLQVLQEQVHAQYQDLEARFSKIATLATENKGAAKAKIAESQSQETVATVKPVANASAASDKKLGVNTQRNASAVANAASASKATASEANLAEEEKIYQAGYDLLKAKKYDAAKAKLQTLVKTYPQGNYAGSAHYWLGEIALLQGHPDDSIKEFNKIIKNNKSNQTKLPEAMLKLGFAYYDKGQWAQAREQWLRVKQRFPGTAVAQMAEVRLQELKEQGH